MNDYPPIELVSSFQELFEAISNNPNILFVPKYREFGIHIPDGGTSFISIEYCPFTGSRLPVSLRDEWFDRIEALGLEPDDPKVPREFLSAEWWLKEKL